MEDLDKKFVQEFSKGAFLVAGEDFGCGSSREHAVWSLRGVGVKGVIAKSFARIFYRNAINNGFLAIECKELDENLKTGDEIDLNLDEGYLECNGKRYECTPIPPFVKDIMEKGGLLNTLD